jgi:NAD-dependent deacetylase
VDEPQAPEPTLARTRALLEGADRVLVLTGAGISADSGVPTFRGHEGLWKGHRAEDLATPAAFRRDPRRVWEWYAMRRRLVAECRPNEAHLALARWSLEPGATIRIVTQNVDGLHAEALRLTRPGIPAPSEKEGAPPPPWPIELHGSLFRTRCTGCGARVPHHGPIDAASEETLPRCPSCGALLRPDVVWFGESLEPLVVSAAFEAAREAGACLVVGTSAVVQPAISVAVTAARSGAALIEVNPERTPLTAGAAIHISGRAAVVVPKLVGRS